MGLENKSFKKFTDEVCSQVKCTEMHEDIKEELNCHLQELEEEYIAQGSTDEEAAKLAVAHMGDSEKIGFDLNKIYQKTPEYKTLFICSIFIALGLLVQFSIYKNAPKIISYNDYIKMIILTILGVILGVVAYFLDYRKLERYSWHIFSAATILIGLILFFGKYINGKLNIIFLGTAFDLSTIASVLFIISLCGLIPKIYNSKYGILKLLLMICFSGYFIILTRQGVSFIVYCVLLGGLLVYSGIPKKLILIMLTLGTFSICTFIFSDSYRIHRLMYIFVFPRNGDIDYVVGKIQLLLSNSKLIGNGISKEVISTTPLINVDFIFTYIIYSFGWIVGITILIMITLLLFNLFKTSKNIKNSYGKLLFKSITLALTIQFLLPIMSNLNLISSLYISMPFIGYNGSSVIMNMVLIGLICGIYGRKNLSKSLTASSSSIVTQPE
ncbi:FtsW/RodA/SpoVE family cell cycle protein [Clostridium sp. C8-1-8]|uniref:FtsW/RodA/SpoVE family cell cycle protein n=1 Tax=Clostridium sp. C8-1-8 TaxID=2698831 RepID=UPI00136EE692|nr:FtsW/RodA/SpoVE family cell cycle protein [Clostridium sp. C8-1-8]